MPPTAKGLSEAWRAAEAATPADWWLMGVACLHGANPNTRTAEEWCAWASGPHHERLEGRGESADDALRELTAHLEGLSR